MPNPRIEWEKLRTALIRLRKEELIDILGAAFEALPKTRIVEVFGEYINIDKIAAPKGSRTLSAGRILKEVQAFHKESLAGEYYEGFNVNSTNWTEKSEGTELWISEIDRLFGKCASVSNKGHHDQMREAFDLLFDLLERIDYGEDFIFFADEQGSWQVGVDYEEIFPAYFAALAATAGPEEYAARVLFLTDEYGSYYKERNLKAARKVATAEQRKALRAQGSAKNQNKKKGH